MPVPECHLGTPPAAPSVLARRQQRPICAGRIIADAKPAHVSDTKQLCGLGTGEVGGAKLTGLIQHKYILVEQCILMRSQVWQHTAAVLIYEYAGSDPLVLPHLICVLRIIYIIFSSLTFDEQRYFDPMGCDDVMLMVMTTLML